MIVKLVTLIAVLAVVSLVLAFVTLLYKKIFTSEAIDQFANDLCSPHPKKSTESLCNDGKRAFEALDERVEQNEKVTNKLQEENDQIKSFSREVATKAAIENELDEAEEAVEEK